MTHNQHAPNAQHSYRLTHGDYATEVLATGATLSRLTHGGRDLIAPADAPHSPGFAGALLAPWPNRVVDGRYLFAGEVRELPINEQGRHHAIHGLAHALTFTPAKPHTANTLELTATLEPTPGYPWQLRLTAHFTLGDDGLRYGVTAENLSPEPAPYGAATHPYLIAGEGPVDTWSLELEVASRLEVAPDRLIPQRLAPWAGFAAPLGTSRIDHAFTGIAWGDDAGSAGESSAGHRTARARVTAPAPGNSNDNENGNGFTGVELTWDSTCPWVQVFTCDLGDEVQGNRAALAVEPQTCAPDAFNAGAYPFDTGLVTLAPGALHEVTWRIAAL
ncbi:aldose epimerase family protein [Leucobacter sp. HY1908]